MILQPVISGWCLKELFEEGGCLGKNFSTVLHTLHPVFPICTGLSDFIGATHPLFKRAFEILFNLWVYVYLRLIWALVSNAATQACYF